MRNLIQFNSNEVLSNAVLNLFKGGKRGVGAYQAAEDIILAKAGRRVNRRLNGQSGSINFFYEGQTYTATYNSEQNMLHVTGANGLDICVEW